MRLVMVQITGFCALVCSIAALQLHDRYDLGVLAWAGCAGRPDVRIGRSTAYACVIRANSRYHSL